jgi:hypothetical protein
MDKERQELEAKEGNGKNLAGDENKYLVVCRLYMLT